MTRDFAADAALILAEIITSYPGLVTGDEVDSADLVDSLTQHLAFNLSPSARQLVAEMTQ